MLLDDIREILEEAQKSIDKAESMEKSEELRVKYLGKKGELTKILRTMGGLTPEERKKVGQFANEARNAIQNRITDKMDEFKKRQQELKFKAETVDVTEPGKAHALGAQHPTTQQIDATTSIVITRAFYLAGGHRVERGV